MRYTIRRSDGEELICARCGRFLSVAVEFSYEGTEMRVGRECAKYYGIIWTPAVGPAADDPETYRQAIEIHRARTARNNYAWPGGWEACSLVKEALGSVAWKQAAREALRRD